MEKLMVGLLATFMVACTAPHKTEPEILSTLAPVQQVDSENEPDSYLVRVNFVLFEPEIAQAPQTSIAFQNALQEWADNLPIECAVFIDKPGAFPFLFNPDSVADQRGNVRVHIVDIQSPPYHGMKGLLGYWSWPDNMLVLDKNTLENDPEKAYSVALHELGHVFGLPHFVNVGDSLGVTGSYSIPITFDARELVMYPISSLLNRTSKLTKLEIAMAWKNILALQQVGRNDCFHLTSP